MALMWIPIKCMMENNSSVCEDHLLPIINLVPSQPSCQVCPIEINNGQIRQFILLLQRSPPQFHTIILCRYYLGKNGRMAFFSGPSDLWSCRSKDFGHEHFLEIISTSRELFIVLGDYCSAFKVLREIFPLEPTNYALFFSSTASKQAFRPLLPSSYSWRSEAQE